MGANQSSHRRAILLERRNRTPSAPPCSACPARYATRSREKDWYEFLDVFGLFTPPLGLLACWLEYIAEHNRKRKGVLALLFTCRQTHNEFIALFYSGVVFDLTAFEFRTGWPCIRQSCYQSV
ncbi:hypothetical protein Alg215_10825, partial [Pyrenophora tritici-repentis]